MFSKLTSSALLTLAVLTVSSFASPPAARDIFERDDELTLYTSASDSDQIVFQDCDVAQQKIIRDAVKAAEGMTADAWNYFMKLGADPPAKSADLTYYNLWFGAYKPNLYKIVYDRFKALHDQAHFSEWKYKCVKEGICKRILRNVGAIKGSHTAARVRPAVPGIVDICTRFWDQGRDEKDRGAILVHEASHFPWKIDGTDLPGTNAVGKETYGFNECQALTKEPEKAVLNADNYGYFVWNKPIKDVDNEFAFLCFETTDDSDEVCAFDPASLASSSSKKT